jgi:hypothetical protein
MSHSSHSKYDLLHSRRHVLQWSESDEQIHATLHFIESTGELERYRCIDGFLNTFSRDLTGDPDAELKMRFNEAMHLCSDMPFHLQEDGREDLSVAIYLSGVRLMNEILEHVAEDFDSDLWLRVSRRRLELRKKQEWRNVG